MTRQPLFLPMSVEEGKRLGIREFDEKTQLHLPVHAQANEPRQTVEPATREKPAEAPKKEVVEDPDELPGGLAEIIRDLTRRPPS